MFKRLIPSALLALLVLPAFAVTTAAQENRLGYVDPDLIIVRMPAYRSIQDSLAQENESIQQELAGLQQNFQTQLQQYQEQAAMLSADARAQRENELRGLQERFQQRQNEALQQLGQREAQLIQPLLTQLQEAIDAVAEREGLAMVFATRANNAPVLLYANDDQTVNISQAVMAELGMEPVEDTGLGE